MKNDLLGINEDKIDTLSLSIRDYADRIKETLNLTEEVMNETQEFYKCEQANKIRSKFNEFQTNFNIVHENISSYADDLVTVKLHYLDENKTLARKIEKAADNIEVDTNIIK